MVALFKNKHMKWNLENFETLQLWDRETKTENHEMLRGAGINITSG